MVQCDSLYGEFSYLFSNLSIRMTPSCSTRYSGCCLLDANEFIFSFPASSCNMFVLRQVNGLFCDLVSEIQSWDLLGATLVPFCLRSLGLIIGMPQNEDLAAYKWTTSDVVEQGSDDIALGVLPLQIVSHILMSLLESAMTCREEIQSVGQTLINGGDSLECFINKLTWDLSRLALGVLMQGSEYRSCAMRLLLPVVFSSLSKPSLVTIQVQGSQYSVSR